MLQNYVVKVLKNGEKSPQSGQNPLHYLAMHIRQAVPSALEFES
jgi:hypothetical protein